MELLPSRIFDMNGGPYLTILLKGECIDFWFNSYNWLAKVRDQRLILRCTWHVRVGAHNACCEK